MSKTLKQTLALITLVLVCGGLICGTYFLTKKKPVTDDKSISASIIAILRKTYKTNTTYQTEQLTGATTATYHTKKSELKNAYRAADGTIISHIISDSWGSQKIEFYIAVYQGSMTDVYLVYEPADYIKDNPHFQIVNNKLVNFSEITTTTSTIRHSRNAVLSAMEFAAEVAARY